MSGVFERWKGHYSEALFFPLGGFTAGRTKHHGPQVLGKKITVRLGKAELIAGLSDFRF